MAEAEAWANYLAAKAEADEDLADAEAEAWEDYLNGVASIEAQLATIEAAIEDQYASVMSAALAAWHAAESAAWTAYTTTLAAIPRIPAPEPRIEGPPEAEPFAGCFIGAQLPPAAGPIVLVRVYNAADFIAARVRDDVSQHVAETNRGTDTFIVQQPNRVLDASRMEDAFKKRVRELRQRLENANSSGGKATTDASPTTVKIQYHILNYDKPQRSGKAEAWVILETTIRTTRADGKPVRDVVFRFRSNVVKISNENWRGIRLDGPQ